MDTQSIIDWLKSLENQTNRDGMARYGINTEKAFGTGMKPVREMARKIGKNHDLALNLWKTGYHEARILAAHTADPKQMTVEIAEEWAKDFNSWDLCDQVCMNLYKYMPDAPLLVDQWCVREETFVKRAAFALIASLGLQSSKLSDEELLRFLPVIERESTDERNFVKKSVNWALRQVGKRSLMLRQEVLKTAERMLELDSKSARWNAKDTIRELNDEKLLQRMKDREK